MVLPGIPECQFQFRILQRNLREEDAAQTLADIAQGRTAPILLPWIPLMHGGNQSGMIEQWKTVAGLETDPWRRALYGGMVLVFAELTQSHLRWQQALEGWNVAKQVSQVMEQWRREARAEGLTEGRAEGRVEGRAEGRVEGRAEGRTEGERERARSFVLRALQVRLAPQVPADMQERIRQENDVNVLNQWFDIALTATRLEDLRTVMGLA